jgi:predicted nucleic acid-binding Zn ribbon protein
VEKLISQSSFQLKGSGWYLTDYARRSTSGTSDNGAKKSEAPKTSTEAKPSTGSKSTSKSSEGTR